MYEYLLCTLYTTHYEHILCVNYTCGDKYIQKSPLLLAKLRWMRSQKMKDGWQIFRFQGDTKAYSTVLWDCRDEGTEQNEYKRLGSINLVPCEKNSLSLDTFHM